MGKRIKANLEQHEYCDDEDTVEAVQKQIQEQEKAGKSYLLQGFPRTKYQAMQMKRMGIVPDRIIMFNMPKQQAIKRVKAKLISQYPGLDPDALYKKS